MPLQLHDTEVIKAPLISEKTTFLANVKNAYTFEVDKSADKDQIKAAIEKLYDVKVLGNVKAVRPGHRPKGGRGRAKPPASGDNPICRRQDRSLTRGLRAFASVRATVLHPWRYPQPSRHRLNHSVISMRLISSGVCDVSVSPRAQNPQAPEWAAEPRSGCRVSVPAP